MNIFPSTRRWWFILTIIITNFYFWGHREWKSEITTQNPQYHKILTIFIFTYRTCHHHWYQIYWWWWWLCFIRNSIGSNSRRHYCFIFINLLFSDTIRCWNIFLIQCKRFHLISKQTNKKTKQRWQSINQSIKAKNKIVTISITEKKNQILITMKLWHKHHHQIWALIFFEKFIHKKYHHQWWWCFRKKKNLKFLKQKEFKKKQKKKKKLNKQTKQKNDDANNSKTNNQPNEKKEKTRRSTSG